MKNITGTLKKILQFGAISGLILVVTPVLLKAQIGIQPPSPDKVVHLFEPQAAGLERIAVDSSLFKARSMKYKRNVGLDSTGKYISISETLDGTEFYLPTVMDVDTYIRFRLKYDTRELWKKTISTNFKGKKGDGFGAITLDIPFRIKSKTFTRIFGSDKIGLKVTGNISFDLSGRTEERSGSAVSALDNQNTFSPRFKQTQQFTVEGHIGDKVNVSVDQNSEAVTEIDNTLKLRYKGDDDEIVKSIEAGNISLSLPSTKYVIFGGSNKGLFGLKTTMQVGNLSFTGIASLEKGQQKELNISGSSKESTVKIKDTDFLKNRYFFIDTVYKDAYENGLIKDPLTWEYPAGKDILKIDVWLSVPQADEDQRYGMAVLDPKEYAHITNTDQVEALDAVGGKLSKGYFRRLPENEYDLDQYRGIVTLKQSVATNEVLAVSYVTSDGGKVGSLQEDIAGSSSIPVIAKMIKAENSTPKHKGTWPLMLRNVYSLGGTNIEKEGFDVRLEYNVHETHDRYPEGDTENSFLHLTGLDRVDENGNVVKGGDEIVDNNSNLVKLVDGILFFPALQPFNPASDGPWGGKIPEKYIVDMYEIIDNPSDFNGAYKFDLVVKSRSTKSTFNLGFYVLEGSEVVTLGGQTMQRDKDYMIDYFSGQLTLLSPEAKRTSSNINIKYERANLFQLDKKTIFGGRLEYKLMDGGFIGLTALYLNKTTLDRRVRVGQEPFSNFVWDVNAAFKFKPRFLTKFMDAMPIIETNAESTLNIEAEFAQVIPNPNSLDNPSTGDDNGVAYIDDFESSKRTTTLGIRYRVWTMASSPVTLPKIGDNALDDKEVDNARGRIAWFNPYQQEHINNIWPDRDVNAQTGQTTDVLGVEFWREPGSDPDSSWAGFMRSTASFPNQSKAKFIELWVKGTKGTMNIDIGEISEDWYIRGETHDFKNSRGGLNKEDVDNNGLLDEGEDIGIDGIAGTLWDKWAEPQKDERFSDGWRYDQINGTEGNGNSRGARYPDTEDLDGNDQLSTANNYFQYSFSLDSTQTPEKWVAGSTEHGWRQFRIPLTEYTSEIGSPDQKFQQIYSVRVWFSDLPEVAEDEPHKRTRIKIATFDFVGNEWEETGIAADEDSAKFSLQDSIFVLETYNTEENVHSVGDRPAYTSPPGVAGVRDRITKAMSKEQSLAMRIIGQNKGLGLDGKHIAEAKKTLYNSLDLSNYERMRMFVYGYENEYLTDFIPVSPADKKSKISVYIRFGSDANNYYEYGQEIYQGWNSINNMDIDLDQLAGIKYENENEIIGAAVPIFVDSLPEIPGGYYKAYNKPSVKTIRYFIVGIKNNGNNTFNGEIWLDELRLSKVRKNKATALRLRANLKLADILSVNAQWESVDADFHNISTQFGKGATRESQSYSGKINVDKFLPGFLNISFPVDARASFSRSIPKYLPRTDKLTGYQNETIEEKISSMFGTKKLNPELAKQVSQSEVYGVGTTIKKRTKSKNWLIRYTIDELLLDLDYSFKHSSNWETRFNNSEQYKTVIKYQIPFNNDKFITPLAFAKGIPLLKLLSDQKIYYVPGAIKLGLTVSDAKSISQRRSADGNYIPPTRTINTTTNRSLTASYKILDNLDFSYSRTHVTDADADTLSHRMLWRQIAKNMYFGKEISINQSFKGNFRPKMFTWLTPNYSYSATYGYRLQNLKYRDVNQSVQHVLGVNFKPGALLKSIYSPKSSGSTSSSGGRKRRPVRKKSTEQDSVQAKEIKPEGGKSMFPNPLMLLYDAIAGWSQIKSSLTINNKIANRYLSDMPSFKYQFGFSPDPGVPQDTTLDVTLIAPSRQSTIRLNTSTSLKIMKIVSINLKHNYSISENESQNGTIRSGNRSRTYFVMGDNPLESFSDFESDMNGFIPDWVVTVSGVEKMLFFSDFAKSISLNHNHSSKVTQQMKLHSETNEYVPNSTNFTNNWSPLFGVKVNTKWGVNATFRLTSSTTLNSTAGAGASKTKTSAMTFGLTYAMNASFKIPIPIWPFKDRTFKNEINFSLTFDSSNNTTFQKQNDQPDFVEKEKNESWKLRPAATYRFSSRVQGSLFYETSTTENKRTGKFTYNEFGISVNIAIRD